MSETQSNPTLDSQNAEDRTLCESNAVCVRLVPEVFLVDDDDRLQIKQEQPPPALRERVEHAVRRCPKLTLSIVDD